MTQKEFLIFKLLNFFFLDVLLLKPLLSKLHPLLVVQIWCQGVLDGFC